MGELWYKDVAYEDAKKLVKENLVNTVESFIASGYWLKYIRDNRGYEQDGYQSLWDCAEKEFGLKISEASRAMSMNDKYSIEGNAPFMSESYKQYNKSQLQEMLTMSDEQMEQVTPDMTIKDIREIKNPKTEEKEIECCDVATNTVNTECEDELTENLYAELEVEPDEEEALNIEFDTDELMQELETEDVADTDHPESENFVEVEMDMQGTDEDENIEAEQPALPEFKNDVQRKKWLENVTVWGLWYEDKNIQALYYKYDFPDGSRLIAVKYRYTAPPWLKEESPYNEYDGSYKYTHYHMIYSAEYKKKHEYEYENYYTNSTTSVSALIKFLKESFGSGSRRERVRI